jgi:hypothetical protein
MSDTPFAKPTPQSDKKIFERHSEKVEFVNPPGAEYYASMRGHGAEHRNAQHAERDKAHHMETSLSRKGRPVE